MKSRSLACLALSSLAACALFPALPAHAALPSGFVDELVTAATGPTAIAFTPDGRLLITRQLGELIVRQGTTNTSAMTIPSTRICNGFERGLLGVAVDPNFGPLAGQNRFIYLFYTFRRPSPGDCSANSANSPVNRVSRFVLADNNTVDLATETVLVDNMPSPNGNHNAGDVQFGRDGYLYITVGDGGCDYAGGGCAGSNDAARDEHVLTGKLLRITKDGGIPPDNPFQGAGTARCNMTGQTTAGNKCQETYGWGLRNPFRLAFDPNATGTRFFINDVGQNVREEIDLGQAGVDYGWNCREGTRVNNTGGPCNPTPTGMVAPVFEYSHGAQIPGTTSPTNCNSITGGAFVPNGLWPGYDNTYLFSDFVCGWIVRLNGANTTGPFTAQDFATNLGGSSAVALSFGPHNNAQALYYTTFAGGGQVRRIFFSAAGNNAPQAQFTVNPNSGAAPLLVNFDGSASSDPDAGNTLTYFWTFGDGTPETSTTTATTSHSYAANGVYTASLRVRDNNFAFSAPTTREIQVGNTAPTAVINSPVAADRFRVGQAITLVGSATDAQDGTLPASALSWTVRLRHNDHTHPLLGPVVGNNVMFTAPAPEDLEATDTSFVEIDLTATDSGGLMSTTRLDFQPRKVAITLATNPTGLTVSANGTAFTGNPPFTSWDGYVLNVAAATQNVGNTTYTFVSWSDGGAALHAIITPATPMTYTATFQGQTPASLNFFTLTPCRLVDTRNPNGPLGGPALTSGAARTFTAWGNCGIPITATAIAVNVTVVGGSNAGDVRVDAAGTTPAVSAINFGTGQTRANNRLVMLSGTGSFSALASVLGNGTVHFLVDVVGYFE